MGRDHKNKSPVVSEEDRAKSKKRRRRRIEDSETGSESESESEHGSKREKKTIRRERKSKMKRMRRKKYSEDEDYSSSEEEKEEEEYLSESEGERRRRKRKRERKRREERERDNEKKKKKKKKHREKGNKGAVTNSWGKFGIIRETDMWNKRPEFTAWLQEVKQMNLESLPNWEEKQMFKDFMEDHNTATFPSKKYYNLDAYYKRKWEKEATKGMKKIGQTEMTVFNDEEVRRQEMQQVRERQKAEEVEALKRSMESGMAQAMKEQALLREEMLYQYKIGNLEAAAAIQRRLDPEM